jgi:hypothetical protein
MKTDIGSLAEQYNNPWLIWSALALLTAWLVCLTMAVIRRDNRVMRLEEELAARDGGKAPPVLETTRPPEVMGCAFMPFVNLAPAPTLDDMSDDEIAQFFAPGWRINYDQVRRDYELFQPTASMPQLVSLRRREG